MLLLKKLTFVPLFLIAFALLINQLTLLLTSYDSIFSLSASTLINLIAISALISASSFLFVLFATVASDWKIVLPVGIAGSAAAIVFMNQPLALIFAVAIFVSLLLTNLNLDNKLKSYLTFQPSALLGPSIRHLSGLLILSFCLVYFFSVSKIIAQNGFQIPDSLIDTALKFTTPSIPNIPEQTSLPQLTPELLKQTGLDPQKGIQPPADLTNDLIKQTVKDQIQTFIKPYMNFVPGVLAVLLFITLQSLTSIINLLVYPLLWLTFLILKKTGFVRFEVEQRPVKKLVV